jgi:selenocysteine-specific elongation factor
MGVLKKRIVGTAGHIDHGKTTLVRAITGVDCDRLPEEKRRGITIELGFASWIEDDLQVGFIDVPGHEKFVKHMLAGIGGIDCALLVVAADESVMPQTREHFAICRLLGIPTGVVAITKSDLVDREMIDLVHLEIEELVAGSFMEGAPILPVSADSGQGVPEVKAALREAVSRVGDRDSSTRVFRLPIDRVFTMKGFGTVVTGTSVSGRIAADAPVEILPAGITSRVRRIHVHGNSRDEAVAGERTSLNLADVAVDALSRGEQVVEPGRLRTSQILTVELHLLPDAKPLRDQSRIRFHHFSAELLGSVRLLGSGESEAAAGVTTRAQIRLESPIVAVAGDRFIVRRYSPSITIGGGRILDPHVGKLTRRTRPELTETLAAGSEQARLELLARLAGPGGITPSELQARWGERVESLETRLAGLESPDLVVFGEGRDRRWLHRSHLDEIRKAAMGFLKAYFQENRTAVAAPRGELLQKILPRDADTPLVSFVLAHLEREKIAVVRGDQVDIPGRSQKLSGAEGDLARDLETRYLEAGLKPPPVSDLIKQINQRPKIIEGVVGYLVKTGVLLKLAENVLIHRDVIGNVASRMKEHSGETIDVGWFKETFGISRKIAIPLLEHLDRTGVTKREGDSRLVL